MGNTTVLHGYIYGWGMGNDENGMSIFSLPREDSWPYLTFDLFAVPRMEHSYNDRLITFGTLYKNFGLERGWPEWRTKFETLLRTMYWEEAHVFLSIESGGSHHFVWKQDVWRASDYDWPRETKRALAASREAMKEPVQRWHFSGGPIEETSR